MTNTRKIRVSKFAKDNGVLSKHVIYALNMTGNPVKSASSSLEIGPDNCIYYKSVAAFSRHLASISAN